MSNRQLEIPGMPRPDPPKPKKPSRQRQMADLQRRVLYLELEVTLLRIGDKDHA